MELVTGRKDLSAGEVRTIPGLKVDDFRSP